MRSAVAETRAPRGLTLLEILTILAIFAVIATSVVSVVGSSVAAQRFERGMDAVSGILLAARLEAIERRRPVEVIFQSPFLQVRLFDVEAAATPVGTAVANDSLEAPGPAGQLLIDRFLPPQLRITTPPATGEETESMGVNPMDSLATPPSPVRLAVFLPDGTTTGGPIRSLTAEDGRWASIYIDGRTGLPKIQPQDPQGDESALSSTAEQEFVAPSVVDPETEWVEERSP